MTYTTKITRNLTLFAFAILLIVSCKKASLPGVKTGTVNRIVQTSAYASGQVESDGNAHVTARGVCWDIVTDPTIDKNKMSDTIGGVGSFTCHITGLTPNTVYYLRAFATNSEGTAYGDPISFTTIPVALPTLTTTGLKSVTLTTAAGGGNISNDGGTPVIARGICWNTTGSPTIADKQTSDGSGTGLFSSTLTDLTIGTTYFVRSYATNSLGTAFGNEVEFIQNEPILDQDGNAYRVVTIGTQIWFGENLKTTILNNGLAIQYISGGNDWANSKTPAYCWFNNDEAGFKSQYGALYNWYAVNTGKLCPAGWHVPDINEFTILITYLGGESIAGGKLKEAGITNWAYPNLGATNGSGFTALPGGGRYNIYSEPGVFSDLGYGCYIWSATETTDGFYASSYDMVFNKDVITKNEYDKLDGGAVRCIKDKK
jgi:uncharacterized protein (TIGR02145 family)